MTGKVINSMREKLNRKLFVFKLQDIGSSVNAYQVSIGVGITRFLMSLSNAYFLKRFKRRPLVMVSGIGMAVCMFVSGTFTKWIKDGKLC